MSTPVLTLNHGFSYASLFELENLQRLDDMFLARLRTGDARLHEQLLAYRRGDPGLTALQVSELLLACAPLLDEVIADLFGIRKESTASARRDACAQPGIHFQEAVRAAARAPALVKERGI